MKIENESNYQNKFSDVPNNKLIEALYTIAFCMGVGGTETERDHSEIIREASHRLEIITGVKR